MCHSLMTKELHVGRRRSSALERDRCIWDRGIRRLRDRDPLVARSLHDRNQMTSKVRHYEAVGVDRSDVFSGRDFEVRLALFADLEVETVCSLDLPEAFSDQRDVAIEVHRLVRRL